VSDNYVLLTSGRRKKASGDERSKAVTGNASAEGSLPEADEGKADLGRFADFISSKVGCSSLINGSGHCCLLSNGLAGFDSVSEGLE